ncbi:MAG: cytidylyltransferase domain-containing protein [Janthinobacterium lividum]
MLSPARTQVPIGPQVVAVIPARGGSKGVPGKNLRRVGGRALVSRAVDACRRAAYVDAVYVSTDDDAIAAEATLAGAGIIRRPAELAGDTASSESALLHALDVLAESGVRPDTLVFAQCTSPFLDPADLDRGVELVRDGVAGSVFSAVATYEFLWRSGPAGLTGQNHDPDGRPRRQDRAADYRETGGFYVLDVVGFRAARHRFFGSVGVVVVPERSSVDVDTEADLEVASALAPLLDRTGAPEGLDVDVVITDFDGVHTDDSALVDSAGTESVRVSRSDGLGVERLQAAGVPLLIVSKETNAVVRARAAKLHVEVVSGVERKAEVVLRWLAEHDVAPDRVAYVGNDVNDLDVMAVVGWPVAVADARPEVRRAARLVLARPGGAGAVRELCDLVLSARAGAGAAAVRPVAAPAAPPAGADAAADRAAAVAV